MDTGLSFACPLCPLHRPGSWKISISPDAGMLRKLVRDRNCRPVLRGILESLLHYLTQNLPKWTARSRHPEKPVLDPVVERNTDWPDQRIEALMKQTQLQTSCTIAQLPEEHKTTAETGFSEKCWSDPQKERLPSRDGGDQRDLIPRRLTTFQLLQSKFIRSTPKPPITHQREVGTLSSSRGAAGDVNHCQDSEHNKHRKDQTRREQGEKRGGSVKAIVAKFAMAEQKEKGENMLKKQLIKPRLIGKGVLLSSLMERLENMATVCKGSDLKSSHERPSGEIKVTSTVKQRVANHERQLQVVDQTVPKQVRQKQMKRKPVGQQLKGHQHTNRQEHIPRHVINILTKVNSNQEEKNNLKAEQMRQLGDERSDQKADGQCSLNHIKAQAHDVNGWKSGECDETQATVQTNIANKLRHGHLELICLTSVTESTHPEPYRLFPQVEAQVNRHVATIMTSPPMWSTCVDSSPNQYSAEPSERSHLEKILNLETQGPHSALQYSDGESSTGEPASTVTDGRCPLKPKTEGLSTYTGHAHVEKGAAEDPNLTKDVNIQRSLPKYIIPRVYRCDYQQDVNDRTDSSHQPAPHPQAIAPLVAKPYTQSNTSTTAFNTGLVTCPPQDMKVQTLQTKVKPMEGKPQEQEQEAREGTPVYIKDTCMLQSFRLSEDTASKDVFEDRETSAVTSIQTGRDHLKQRPKYTTINYGDPSIKQTYTPKIIRFTDTFTF